MKAIVLLEYGGPDKLVLREHAEPQPGAGQLKIRVSSASINPIDWKLRSGAYQSRVPLELPTILGRDVAGEVLKLGPGVSAFQVGDQVMGLVNNGYAELVVAPVESWAKLPLGLEPTDAGALPLALLTGDQLAMAALGDAEAKGKTVLVTGATGAVGRVAAWVAKQRGATVIAGVRGKHLAEAKALGVDGVIALDDQAALAQLGQVDFVADTVGGETTAQLLPKLKSGGVISSAVGEPAGAKAHGITVHAFMTRPDAKRLFELGTAVANGLLIIPIARRFPLVEAAAAQAFAERGGGNGKVLLIV
jgi:NADPH:quinone reductase-like Zn-dependent oxidoreductase